MHNSGGSPFNRQSNRRSDQKASLCSNIFVFEKESPLRNRKLIANQLLSKGALCLEFKLFVSFRFKLWIQKWTFSDHFEIQISKPVLIFVVIPLWKAVYRKHTFTCFCRTWPHLEELKSLKPGLKR